MTWQTPKTNWVRTDAFTAADYARIRENAAVLRGQAAQLYVLPPRVENAATLPDADDTAVCSESFLNDIEAATAALPRQIYEIYQAGQAAQAGQPGEDAAAQGSDGAAAPLSRQASAASGDAATQATALVQTSAVPPPEAKAWLANAPTPAAEDWNRIEGVQRALRLVLSAQQTALPVLALTLGGGEL